MVLFVILFVVLMIASLRGVALGPGAGSGHRMVSRIQVLPRLTFRTRSLVELEESWVL